MAPTIEQTKKGYGRMWDECTVVKEAEADKVADDVLANKSRYLEIEKSLGVPWIMAGAIHMRESSLNFTTHLHNGDSLSGYTHQVPAGRPKVGHGPPFSFEESAADALKMKGYDKLKGTWTIELMLFDEEGYNGWGYLNKGNSPYLWSWTSEYHGGKYTRDHYYDPNVWDKQPGTAAIMKALAKKDASAREWTERRAVQGTIPADATKRATTKERNAAGAGAAAGTAGTAGTVAPKPDNIGGKVTITFASALVMTVGLAVALVAGILLYRKTQAIKARWLGA